jgi:RNA polymerase sigma-70 factor (ECF subfamily)
MEDRDLIERFKKGDKNAFDELVERYKDMVFRVVYRMLGDRTEAFDVSQEVFLKLYGSLKDFRFEARFSTYLYRMAINFAKNRLKTMSTRRKRHVSLETPMSEESDSDHREYIADDRPDPREAAATQELRDIIWEAIGQLSEEHREILILREFESMSYDAIAQVLLLDPGTVKSRLSRARRALKEILEKKEII